MASYKVTLRNPRNKEEVLLERSIDQEDLDTGGQTYYAVKKKFYKEISNVIPELKEVFAVSA